MICNAGTRRAGVAATLFAMIDDCGRIVEAAIRRHFSSISLAAIDRSTVGKLGERVHWAGEMEGEDDYILAFHSVFSPND